MLAKQIFGGLYGVAGSLWRILQCHFRTGCLRGFGHSGRMRTIHRHNLFGTAGLRQINCPIEHRPTTDTVQHFHRLGFHAGALTRSKNDGST